MLCCDVQYAVEFYSLFKHLPDVLRGLLGSSWLGSCHKGISGEAAACAGNWLLVLARLSPVLMVVLFDTTIFFQLVVFVYGMLHGVFVQKLGHIVTWQDMMTRVRAHDCECAGLTISSQARNMTILCPRFCIKACCMKQRCFSAVVSSNARMEPL